MTLYRLPLPSGNIIFFRVISECLRILVTLNPKVDVMARSFFRSLVSSPEVNPFNQKAKSIPILNPFDRYGRVFFFSWFGFIVAFLSWYAFPPLVSLRRNPSILLGVAVSSILTFISQLTVTIKKDLNMSQDDVANSNIVALLAT